MDPFFLFVVIALILSIVIHEVAHGYAAEMLGDPTAKLQGRLTLNPIKHIDPLGSVLIPGILVLTGAQFLFGWAKPVPYNPYNLRNQKWGEAIVAVAGPLTNIGIALIFGLIIRFGAGDIFNEAFVQLSLSVVYLNILLAFFNMIPIPPLDGSKILKAFLPYRAQISYTNFEAMITQYSFIALFAFLFLFMTIIGPYFTLVVFNAMALVTGLSIPEIMQFF